MLEHPRQRLFGDEVPEHEWQHVVPNDSADGTRGLAGTVSCALRHHTFDTAPTDAFEGRERLRDAWLVSPTGDVLIGCDRRR
jgi:hypothetical protein